jgi:hypothetical protein
MTRRDERRAKGRDKHYHQEAVAYARQAMAYPCVPTSAGDYWTEHGCRSCWGHAALALLRWALSA